MKSIAYLSAGLLLLASCGGEADSTEEQAMEPLNYPETRKGTDSTVYFGTTVNDPYRWLEDDRSEETEAWVKTQNEFTFGYLDKIEFRDKVKERCSALWDYEKL